jgi:hypothetical protein
MTQALAMAIFHQVRGRRSPIPSGVRNSADSLALSPDARQVVRKKRASLARAAGRKTGMQQPKEGASLPVITTVSRPRL